jgi:single-strand DNA-binding protein
MANTKLPNLNKVLIVGNLVKDPELRYTTTGAPVVNFKIASNKKFRDGLGMQKEEVCYIGVVAWQKLAESCGAG